MTENTHQTRTYWASTLQKVAGPVFEALAKGELRATMPQEQLPGRNRTICMHLEAVGRSLSGLAPYLELGGNDSRGLFDTVVQALTEMAKPDSPDHIDFAAGHQCLVDAAFLAHGFLRAPSLWAALDDTTQSRLIDSFIASRVIQPGYNNWLLFSATVEAFLYKAGVQPDLMRVDYAVRQHMAWYKGDGTYGDGPDLHHDYYNSYVIQPMLLDVLATMNGSLRYKNQWAGMLETARKRAARYAEVQERMIAPDGSFPVIGRSLAYRCGAFQHLAQMALQDNLPESLPPSQVRGALTAVIRRTLEAPGTFDENGWLTIGLCGHQPGIAENYISTGSVYLCSMAFLPLGLPPDHPFWADEAHPFTGQRVWSGSTDIVADKALYG